MDLTATVGKTFWDRQIFHLFCSDLKIEEAKWDELMS